VAFGLPPMDYMRRSDFPRMTTRRQKLAFVSFLVVGAGLGIVSIFGNFAEVMGVWAGASVLWLIGVLAFIIRRSRPAKTTESRSSTGSSDGGLSA